MVDFDFPAYVNGQLESARTAWTTDFEVLEVEQLGTPLMGHARTPYDLNYELVSVNRRFAKRLQGEDPGPWPFVEGWAKAPEEYCDKPFALREFESTMDAMIQSLGTDLFRKIETSSGQTTAFELGLFCAFHILYHDAQLNYIQELCGDMAMHTTED